MGVEIQLFEVGAYISDLHSIVACLMYIQGVSGGIVNIVVGSSMVYSE